MTRKMADSVAVASLPDDMNLYAGYIDGRYVNVEQVRARFPGKTVIAVTTNPSDNEGDCLDVENGDATAGDAPGWVRRRRLAGHDGPLVYCSEAIWPAVKGAFAAARTAQPSYWLAGYPGAEGDAIPTGAVAHQWIDHGGWDESCVVDYLPGIDPTPTGEDIFTMLASDPAFAVRYLYRVCLHREVDAAGFATYVGFLNNGGTLNELMTILQDSDEGKAVIAAERKSLGLV